MKRLLVLSMAAVIAAPAFVAPQMASAQTYESCREQQRRSANKGTLVGGLGGALLGGTVAGNGAKTEGAVLGGVVGAVAGHQIAKKNARCSSYPRRSARSSQAAPRRVSQNRSRDCRMVDERYGGRNHSYQVCRDRDGVWRPT
jgi:uncharacterized protein YcfJ